jgi:hypothetical protein
MKRSNRLHVAQGSMPHLHDVMSSLFFDFDCRQSSLGIPSTSTVCCGAVALWHVHQCMHGRFKSPEICRVQELLFSLPITSLKGLIEAESLDFGVRASEGPGWARPAKVHHI